MKLSETLKLVHSGSVPNMFKNLNQQSENKDCELLWTFETKLYKLSYFYLFLIVYARLSPTFFILVIVF